MPSIYRGDRTIDGILVTVDGAALPDGVGVHCYTDRGFEWSYEGEGPRQLAFALLLRHTGDADAARRDDLAFMEAVVANFENEWEMSDADIERALANLRAEA
jgi:hypothetical protein